jgi:hypothetical protein
VYHVVSRATEEAVHPLAAPEVVVARVAVKVVHVATAIHPVVAGLAVEVVRLGAAEHLVVASASDRLRFEKFSGKLDRSKSQQIVTIPYY